MTDYTIVWKYELLQLTNSVDVDKVKICAMVTV